jgi:hypothetical protein
METALGAADGARHDVGRAEGHLDLLSVEATAARDAAVVAVHDPSAGAAVGLGMLCSLQLWAGVGVQNSAPASALWILASTAAICICR